MKQKLSKDILMDINELNLEEDITLEDIENIEAFFSTQPKIDPPESLFDNIMEAVEEKIEEDMVHQEVSTNKSIFEGINKLLFNVIHQVSLLDKRFWIISIIILLSGCIFIRDSQYLSIVLLAPVVYVFSIYYLYRGAYYNVLEMEMSCKYSMYEITLARTMIILIYNIGFSSIMAFINCIMRNTNIWAFLVVTWITPLLMSYCIALYFFYKKGVIHSIISNIVVWILYALLFQSFFKFQYTGEVHILNLSNNIEWININFILILISSIMLGILFKDIKKTYG